MQFPAGVPGAELDRSLGVEGAAARTPEDVQAQPAKSRVEVDSGGPGTRMPALQQVGLVPDDEGAEPGAHELLRGGRGGLAPVQTTAAVRIGLRESAVT